MLFIRDQCMRQVMRGTLETGESLFANQNLDSDIGAFSALHHAHVQSVDFSNVTLTCNDFAWQRVRHHPAC